MSNLSKDFFCFGCFAYQSNKLDGQTVKTRSVHQLFEAKLGLSIPFYDTEEFKSDNMSLLRCVKKLLSAKHVIYLPAHRNLRNFFPVLYLLSIIASFDIHYFVIGGWLPEFINKNGTIGRKLKKIKALYVETDCMLQKLKATGFNNVHWFPNFRIRQENTQRMELKSSDDFRMVFMSRIKLSKGIDIVFRFLEWSRNQSFFNRIQVDFYGNIEAEDRKYFFENLNKHPCSAYKGILQPEMVQSVIAQYDLFLFPTYYRGEGCPGAIIDAFMASVPVLASNWKYNSEFIIDGQTGYLFDLDNESVFYERIEFLINHRSNLLSIKQNAYNLSKQFTPEKAWRIIEPNLVE